MSLSSINPLVEGASAILYHFITPERFCEIISTNQFTPSPAEYDINGEGVNYMSFSRTGSFRHGWPICMQSECGTGSEWGIVRLTIDGNMFNTHPNFKDANGIQSSVKVAPFDWAYHSHTRTGSRIKDNYDLSVDADNGKEWMIASDDSMYGALPFNPGDYNYELEDRYAQPYSQAEDRLLTRAKHIPYADRYIKRVDIILMKIPNEEDYGGCQERQEEREALYKAISNSRFKDIAHLYDSIWSLEHGKEIPKEELLRNTSNLMESFNEWLRDAALPPVLQEACNAAYLALFEADSWQDGDRPTIEQTRIVEFVTDDAAADAMAALDRFKEINTQPQYDHYIDEVEVEKKGRCIVLRGKTPNALAYVAGFAEGGDPDLVVNYRRR